MPSYDLASIITDIEGRRSAAHPLIVAIDGPSGSGKTRLARRFKHDLAPATLLRMDHVVAGWDGLEGSVDQIRGPLEQLRSGAATSYRMWNWEDDDWGQLLTRDAAPSIVLEGCGSGAVRLADLVDYLVWVDAPRAVRHERAMRRDGATYEPHWQRWAAQEAAHFEQNHTRKRADLIIDGRRPVR